MSSNDGIAVNYHFSIGETWTSKSKDSVVILSFMQWWIQDFKEGWGRGQFQRWGGGVNLLFDRFFPENCMKMKDNWTESSESFQDTC